MTALLYHMTHCLQPLSGGRSRGSRSGGLTKSTRASPLVRLSILFSMSSPSHLDSSSNRCLAEQHITRQSFCRHANIFQFSAFSKSWITRPSACCLTSRLLRKFPLLHGINITKTMESKHSVFIYLSSAAMFRSCRATVTSQGDPNPSRSTSVFNQMEWHLRTEAIGSGYMWGANGGHVSASYAGSAYARYIYFESSTALVSAAFHSFRLNLLTLKAAKWIGH